MQEEIRLGVNVKVTGGDIHRWGLVLVHVLGTAGEGGVDPGLFLHGESYWSLGGAHSANVGVVLCAGVVCVHRLQGLQTAAVCGARVDVESVAAWV